MGRKPCHSSAGKKCASWGIFLWAFSLPVRSTKYNAELSWWSCTYKSSETENSGKKPGRSRPFFCLCARGLSGLFCNKIMCYILYDTGAILKNQRWTLRKVLLLFNEIAVGHCIIYRLLGLHVDTSVWVELHFHLVHFQESVHFLCLLPCILTLTVNGFLYWEFSVSSVRIYGSTLLPMHQKKNICILLRCIDFYGPPNA